MMSRSPAFSLSPSCLHLLLLSLLHMSLPLSLVLGMSPPSPSSTGALCIPDALAFVFYPASQPSHPPGLWIQIPPGRMTPPPMGGISELLEWALYVFPRTSPFPSIPWPQNPGSQLSDPGSTILGQIQLSPHVPWGRFCKSLGMNGLLKVAGLLSFCLCSSCCLSSLARNLRRKLRNSAARSKSLWG